MDHIEAEKARDNLELYDKLNVARRKLTLALECLEEQISGNTSMVRKVTRIQIIRTLPSGDGRDSCITLDDTLIRDWSLRMALEKLICDKRDELTRAIEEL